MTIEEQPRRVLLIEDNPGDARLLQEMLVEMGSSQFALERAGRLLDALTRLGDTPFDLVLLDLSLPDSHGLETFQRVYQEASCLPIIVLTGLDDESVALQAVREGAQDYLVKGQVDGNLLIRAIQYALERKRTQSRLEELFSQVQQSRDDLVSILNQLHLGTVMTDQEGKVTFLSEPCQLILGKNEGDVLGQSWEQLYPFEKQEKAALQAMAERPSHERTKVPVHLDVSGGKRYYLEVDVQDVPRDPQRKILFLYDATEIHDLRRQLEEKAQFHDLVGKSKPMQAVYQRIREVAGVDATVLIEGDTGTGKELVARAIHSSSPRQGKPFIAVNCAGLTDSLLGSQLFGHKRGAFTGATEDHCGFFEAANGGTLFLDEIGDMPLTVQTTLLRALQEKEITRLGESQPRKVDVRVLAATHQNLSELVNENKFRADLLYRIRVARILLPALPERREDLPLLAGVFLNRCCSETGKAVQEISTEAMQRLMKYPWPGNVRELKSALEYAVIHCSGTVLQLIDLPPELLDTSESLLPHPEPETEQDEKERILLALERTRGKRAAAARLLGISRAHTLPPSLCTRNPR